MEDSDGEEVQSFNYEAKYFPTGEAKLPKEVKSGPKNVMIDTSILRRIGDAIGFQLIYFTDDLADFFLQLKQHPSELWKVTFPWLDDSGELIHIAETVLGFGLSFASNVAQRFANVICQIFLDQFVEYDEPFLQMEAREHPQLRQWLEHRRSLTLSAVHETPNAITVCRYSKDALLVHASVNLLCTNTEHADAPGEYTHVSSNRGMEYFAPTDETTAAAVHGWKLVMLFDPAHKWERPSSTADKR